MSRQTVLGFLFLIIGLFLLCLAGLPILVAATTHQALPEITGMVITLILIGLATALFGAFLLPSSGAPVTFNNFMISLGRTNLPFVGGRKTTAIEQPKDGPQ